MILSAEPTNCTTFMCDYLHTQFDAAHLLSELGFSIAFELLQLVFIVWLWRRVIKPKLHKEFDEGHGIEHHEDHVHLSDDVIHEVPTFSIIEEGPWNTPI